jgi:hypothetical protein
VEIDKKKSERDATPEADLERHGKIIVEPWR